MNVDHINFIRSLDPQGCYGTVQGVLLSGNLQEKPFESVAKYLLKTMMQEREQLLKENKKMFMILKQNKLEQLILEV